MKNIYLCYCYIVLLTPFAQSCTLRRAPLFEFKPNNTDIDGSACTVKSGKDEPDNSVLAGSGMVEKDRNMNLTKDHNNSKYNPPKDCIGILPPIEIQDTSDSAVTSDDEKVQDGGAIQKIVIAQDAADGSDANREEASQDSAIAQEASTEYNVDATICTDPSSPEDQRHFCEGTKVFDLCWYLTSRGDSCYNHCDSHGGYNSKTASYVGIAAQGGQLDNCSEILKAIGRPMPVNAGFRTDLYGFGCHIWDGSGAWWLSSPIFSPTVWSINVEIVCACNK